MRSTVITRGRRVVLALRRAVVPLRGPVIALGRSLRRAAVVSIAIAVARTLALGEASSSALVLGGTIMPLAGITRHDVGIFVSLGAKGRKRVHEDAGDTRPMR